MSKTRQTSYIRILLLLLALQIFTEVRAQGLSVTITVDRERRAAHIEGEFAEGYQPATDRIVTFRSQVIGDGTLAERISSLQFSTADGVRLPSLPMRPGEFVVQPGYAKWRYSVSLGNRPNRAAAHASWMSDDAAVLMLDDLLPIFGGNRRQLKTEVSLRSPDGWRAMTSAPSTGNGRFSFSNTEGAVIFAGRNFREIPVRAKGGKTALIIDGEWHFTDAEAAAMAGEIYDAYTRKLGTLPTESSVFALLKFPVAENPGVWEAETRGSTVTIVSSDTHFKTQSQQRLHEQFRHEIFHLWFPNASNLTGDYRWFYEGFALYESLKLGVELKRIRFDDLLDTLSRAYTIDRNSRPVGPFSDSVNTDPTLLYARGMLIAFMTDLKTIRSSGGKRDSTELLKELFARHKGSAASIEANVALQGIIGSDAFEKFVLEAQPIDWTNEVTSAGFESSLTRRTFQLRVTPNPDGRQRAILKSLGYN